ncbi:hypothetical protein IT568_13485, partial [bacterium]|nr:hypothetical protein [bacterium]
RNEMREEFRSLRSDSNTMFSVLIGGMLTIVFLIFWDRRTFLRPVVNELESTAKETKAIVNVLRDFAKQEPKMFEAMKKETLL